MSAFEGVRAIRIQLESTQEKNIETTIAVIKSTEADANTFDFEAAKVLLGIVDNSVPPYGRNFYQHCIHCVVLTQQPIWAKLMTLGRKRFVKKLDRDEQNIFREAGLLVEPPNDFVIDWWDSITGLIRLESDKLKLNQARQAEKLTLMYEAERLSKKNISVKPIWTAIEDNTAGYDILSYSKNEYGLINKLIEVKSTIASPLRFYLTRNEWNHAIKFGENYFFHIWDMQKNPPNLFIKTIDEIKPHIPVDSEKGVWKTAEIPVNLP